MAGGQWGTITFEVPDFLEDVRNAINSIAEFLLAMLDIALTALDFVKTFLVGFLDPIAALVQAILDEIEGFMRDLRQLGIYLTGDWPLLTWPFEDLLGGYREYERRMIARLTDRTDPTRPDVSSKTIVFSIFFYLSVDISEIQRLIDYINQLIAFFKQSYRTAGGQPTPIITSVKYGTDAASILHPSSIAACFNLDPTPPALCEVKWSLPSTAQKNPFNPFPPLPPGGFVVTVSTIPDGIRVLYDRPQANETLKPSQGGKKTQPREYGIVRVAGSGEPLVLFGGGDQVAYMPSSHNYNTGVSDNAIKAGYKRVYGAKKTGNDLALIPLDQLGSGLDSVFQRTFYVGSATTGASWMTGEYSVVLEAKDMPYDGRLVVNPDGTIDVQKSTERAATLHVRVAACSKATVENQAFKYNFGKGLVSMDASGQSVLVPLLPGTSVRDVGPWSKPARITFPNQNTQKYMETVKAALILLVLSRPDLMPLDEFRGMLPQTTLDQINAGRIILNNVALQRCGLEQFRHLAGIVYNDYRKAVEAKGEDPLEARKDLFDRVDRVVRDVYDITGPMPDVEKFVVENCKELREIQWGKVWSAVHPDYPLPSQTLKDATILKLFDPGTSKEPNRAALDPNSGFALNPHSAGLTAGVVRGLFLSPGAFLDRKPQMMEAAVDAPDSAWSSMIVTSAPPEEAARILASAPPGLRSIYERCRQSDGSLLVPPEITQQVERTAVPTHYEGSADLSPVFVLNRDALESVQAGDTVGGMGMFYARSLLAQYEGGKLLQQASIALGVAGSALRRPIKDGAWIAIRFFDAWPVLEDVLGVLYNWIDALRQSLQSIIDTIRKYIEFLEARIIEWQALIRRINALLQAILGFMFQIPRCSALFLMSKGTGGVLADFVASQNKPNDSPLAYGAGLAMVVPAGPTWVMDLIRELMKQEDGSPGDGYMATQTTVEGMGQPAIPPPESEEPDVL